MTDVSTTCAVVIFRVKVSCITSVNTINWRDTTHFDSEDDYRTGCRNVSHCQQQQSYSGLRSPGRSNWTFWNESWVQTFHRKALVKLIISNNKLMIEQGKYNQISGENRHCPLCGSNQIEDEVHFLFHCSKYSIIRNNFYQKVQSLSPNITQLHVNDLSNELMNSSNYYINLQLVKYIIG